ncbi:MAG: septum formation initiator family protein [Nitrospira sp. SB0672_bin_25]|nr:septum formation initiator family protein [Nitrospira sp. SB0666_bin_27]MYF23859.1 septum formation initiator family protein [Nitrospira sp. SB0678_bin_10]MYJ53323.1 septum formation initiator family protein [Nitrospira sp. SB0672_bin_25]
MVRQNRKLKKPGRWSGRRSLRYPLGLSIGIMLCVVWTLQGTGLPQYWMMTQELDRTQEEIVSLEHANAALREEIHHLESDLFTLEELARERLGYVKEGETVYQFVESP